MFCLERVLIVVCFLASLNLAVASLEGEGSSVQEGADKPSSSNSTNRVDLEEFSSRIMIGKAYLELGSHQEAIDVLKIAKELNPDSLDASFVLAATYLKDKQTRKAFEIYTEIEKRVPDNYLVKNNLAWLYATAQDPELRNPKLACIYAEEALMLAPDDPNVWSTLSEACYSNGEYKRAERAILQAQRCLRTKKKISQKLVESLERQTKKCIRAAKVSEQMAPDASLDPKPDNPLSSPQETSLKPDSGASEE